ncbi:hypothetical protein WOLCODRAFT_136933 [Wolfiporia cocos MD-104 SS10]|uniref:Uncharacterized protein n=1 Tax=Wolfiporia cocos (strain MD-104) TaxID=742152 RepID=A0A2H3JEF4_WOLCO|nr:hypothetical protein WOLCODRAFT_136933 [Wolfiporia cocos MD-104 SS10]
MERSGLVAPDRGPGTPVCRHCRSTIWNTRSCILGALRAVPSSVFAAAGDSGASVFVSTVLRSSSFDVTCPQSHERFSQVLKRGADSEDERHGGPLTTR